MWMKLFNKPALAGDSLKPRVERSVTLGYGIRSSQPAKAGDRVSVSICRPFHGLRDFAWPNPGFAALHPGL